MIWLLICLTIKNLIQYSKDIILNSTHYFITKIPNKLEVQKVASYNSSDIDF